MLAMQGVEALVLLCNCYDAKDTSDAGGHGSGTAAGDAVDCYLRLEARTAGVNARDAKGGAGRAARLVNASHERSCRAQRSCLQVRRG